MKLTRTTHDVIVLGGGIFGISIADKLISARGLRTAVFEKKEVGCSGATANSGGFIRAFDFNIFHANLALMSLNEHLKIRKAMDFKRTGHLFILKKHDVLRSLPILKQFLKFNYPFKVLDSKEAKSIAGRAIEVFPDEFAIWEPNAGSASPSLAAHHMKRQVLKGGGTVFERCAVRAIYKDSFGVSFVKTDMGTFTAESIVICLGGWNRSFLKSHGIFCENKLIELIYVRGSSEVSQGMPCLNDGISGVYSKPESNDKILIGIPQKIYNVNPDCSDFKGGKFFEKNEPIISSRIRGYRHCDIVQKVSSSDSYTSSDTPDIMRINKSWFLVNGMNGTGFKLYPAISSYFVKKYFN